MLHARSRWPPHRGRRGEKVAASREIEPLLLLTPSVRIDLAHRTAGADSGPHHYIGNPGASRVDQLANTLAAVDLVLDDGLKKELDDLTDERRRGDVDR